MAQQLIELIEQFCPYQRKQRGRTEGGVKTYRWNLEQFLAFLKARDGRLARMADLTTPVIQAWLDDTAADDPVAAQIRGTGEADLRLDEPLALGVPTRVQGAIAVNRLNVRDVREELLGARRLEATGLGGRVADGSGREATARQEGEPRVGMRPPGSSRWAQEAGREMARRR